MISYAINTSQNCDFDFLIRATDVQTASGYIVNCNYYDKLIDLYEWSVDLLDKTRAHWLYANDQVWKRFQKDDLWFCFKTRIGKQRAGYSDNSERFNDYNV